MSKSIIETLCEDINKARNLKYPDIGYLMYADIRGDGHSKRGLYVIINENGGVSKTGPSGSTSQIANRLREVLKDTLKLNVG